MGVIQRQGIKNTISGYIGILIGFVSLMVIQPYFLSKEELGLTRVLYSFSFLVSALIPLGITSATIRYFPAFRDEKERHYGFFGFMILFPLVGFLLSSALIYFLRDFIMDQYREKSPLFNHYFIFVFPLMFFTSFTSVLSVYCNANYKSTIPSYLNDIVVRILTIVIVSIYFFQWVSLDHFIFLFVAIYAFQFAGLLFYILKFDKPSFRIRMDIFRTKNVREIIRYGLILWIPAVSSLGLKYFDSILVGKYMTLDFVAIYTIAAFIPTIIETPANALDRIGSARIAAAWNSNNISEIQDIYKKSSLYMFLFGAFVFVLINTNIHTLLQLLPEGYQKGEMVVRIIATGTLFNMATGLNIPILQNSSKYHYSAIMLVVLAFFVLFLQMILIKSFGLIGAAIATASGSLLYNSYTCYLVYHFFKMKPFTMNSLFILLITLAVFFIEMILPHFDNVFIDIIFRTTVVVFVFIASIYRLKVAKEFHAYLPWSK